MVKGELEVIQESAPSQKPSQRNVVAESSDDRYDSAHDMD